MNCKMKQLALAVGMAVGGMGLLPSAQAVNVSSDNLGQALIFPYYTVRGGWNTLIGVTNTTSQRVAVRVRFREAWDSRDVQDFVVVLSPQDLWNATVSDSPTGPTLTINADENTCTVGLGSKTVPFPTLDSDGETPISYSGNVDRMREGYVEMIMMGAGPENTPPTCTDLVKNFMGQGIAYDTALSNLRVWFPSYPASPLKGTFSLVNAAAGYNAVGLPTALANFRSTPDITLHQPPTLVPGLTATNATQIAYNDSWHEPSLNAADNGGLYLDAAGVSQTDTAIGVAAVTWALQATNVINEWSHNPNGITPGGGSYITATDWVISFPTKNFYVDSDTGEYSGKASGRLPTPPSGTGPFTSPYNSSTGKSCDVIKPTVYDRSEHTVDVQYPSPSGRFQVCHEVNVLTFNTLETGAAILTSPDTVFIPYDSSQFLYGWMNVGFSSPGPLPAIGFAITSRSLGDGDALLNEAALYDHSYIRPVTVTPADAAQ